MTEKQTGAQNGFGVLNGKTAHQENTATPSKWWGKMSFILDKHKSSQIINKVCGQNKVCSGYAEVWNTCTPPVRPFLRGFWRLSTSKQGRKQERWLWIQVTSHPIQKNERDFSKWWWREVWINNWAIDPPDWISAGRWKTLELSPRKKKRTWWTAGWLWVDWQSGTVLSACEDEFLTDTLRKNRA